MLKFIICISLVSISGSALAQSADCNQIRNNPASKQRCLDAQREADSYAREAQKQNRRANIRDGICVADSVAAAGAAKAAGFAGMIVYRGTRAAADAISQGASSCVKRAY
jgi:catalase (peroxidase I)